MLKSNAEEGKEKYATGHMLHICWLLWQHFGFHGNRYLRVPLSILLQPAMWHFSAKVAIIGVCIIGLCILVTMATVAIVTEF